MNDPISIDKTVTVFISYSWDDEEHKDWVLTLADKLTKEGGVYVILDRYDLKAGKQMTLFMEKAVNSADKVLLIMTPPYKDKADDRVGGVGYEYSMVTQELYEKQDSEKFIPIRRKGKYDECAPKFLKAFLSHDMSIDAAFENNFVSLLRIIYDEPEIKRPPIGAKPSFISTDKKRKTTALIDEKDDLANSKMKTYAKWTFDIKINSLSDQHKSNLFTLLTSNVIIEKDKKYILPFILSTNLKTSHYPNIIFDNPLRRHIAYNHLIHEKLKIDDGSLHYEFCEYSDHDFWLLFISQPFSTLFYLLVILRSVHDKLSRQVDISILVKFSSDRKCLLYSNHSPFNYSRIYNMQHMTIPDHNANLSVNISAITKDSIFDVFERLYQIFVAEDPKSAFPFVRLDRQHFNMVTDEFLK